jgi:transposase
MSLQLRPGHRVFVFRQFVDMRAGFDRLSMLVREQMKMKIIDGDLFLFIGRNRKRLKGICYDGTGLLLIAKRLEQGKFMNIEDLEFEEIIVEEMDWLLRGTTIKRRIFGEEALTKSLSHPNLSLSHGPDRAGNKL